jgi:hypothetical protein
MSHWSELDFDMLIEVLDQAITSDDPRIKSALDRLLMLTALINPKTATYPIGDLSTRVTRLEQDLKELKHLTHLQSCYMNSTSR